MLVIVIGFLRLYYHGQMSYSGLSITITSTGRLRLSEHEHDNDLRSQEHRNYPDLPALYEFTGRDGCFAVGQVVSQG